MSPIPRSIHIVESPLKALIDIAAYYLKIDNLTEDRVLEMAVQNAIEKSESKSNG
jgi:glutamate formiminotransferase